MSVPALMIWAASAMTQPQASQHSHHAKTAQSQSAEQSAEQGHAMHSERPSVITRCTQGSFVEAINTLNGASKANLLLQQSNDANAIAARKEVQALAVIALGRANAEAHCAKGLDASYQESYRKVLQNALNQARAGNLPERAIAQAESALIVVSKFPRAMP